MRSETDDGYLSCSKFLECSTSYELEYDKPVLPKIEHLKSKIGKGEFDLRRAVLNRNAEIFFKT